MADPRVWSQGRWFVFVIVAVVVAVPASAVDKSWWWLLIAPVLAVVALWNASASARRE
jgi:cobalamin synthase